MSISYAWTITGMECVKSIDGLSDVVISVSWQCSGDDGDGHEGSATGKANVTPYSGGTFIPYNDLTQNDVIGWLSSCINMESIEDGIAYAINAQVNPVVVYPPLPWSN